MEAALPLRASIEDDIYEMNVGRAEGARYREPPGELDEALELTAKSRLVKDTLGEHVFTKFIENKRIEWDNYRTWVTDYELNEYYPKL